MKLTCSLVKLSTARTWFPVSPGVTWGRPVGCPRNPETGAGAVAPTSTLVETLRVELSPAPISRTNIDSWNNSKRWHLLQTRNLEIMTLQTHPGSRGSPRNQVELRIRMELLTATGNLCIMVKLKKLTFKLTSFAHWRIIMSNKNYTSIFIKQLVRTWTPWPTYFNDTQRQHSAFKQDQEDERSQTKNGEVEESSTQREFRQRIWTRPHHAVLNYWYTMTFVQSGIAFGSVRKTRVTFLSGQKMKDTVGQIAGRSSKCASVCLFFCFLFFFFGGGVTPEIRKQLLQ